MSKRGIETPRKSRRLNDEVRFEEFHSSSFNILSQTQTQSSTAKQKSRSEKSKMKKKKKEAKEIEKKRKGKEKQTVVESEKEAKERGKKRKGKQIQYSSDSESDFVDELIKSKSKKSRGTEIDSSQSEKKTQTHLSSCINMNVFADPLTFLGQDKFQEFLQESPFGFFYNMHNIKIQCQLLRHIFMMGGSVHSRKIKEAVDKLAIMIPLFLTSTGFYGKILDLYANNLPDYQQKSHSEPLSIKHVTNVPQQEESSNDCGLCTYLFAEYMSNGVFDVSHIDIDSKYHRQRYGTLLWHYAKSKNDEGAISESEVTGTVVSKKGGPRTHKEQVMDTTNYPTPKFRNRK
ncbi:uncharacterized protein LOC107001203 [Solanum pennellii]|uniref:Uncharacterized protein LOC107001203 n=1 Tax=Solanum pennellii TaxID=28526 RepID=A0ABM1FCD2_SOLPN|nr:uncharacterized protein LOC107001203 [Solanum pennellii]